MTGELAIRHNIKHAAEYADLSWIDGRTRTQTLHQACCRIRTQIEVGWGRGLFIYLSPRGTRRVANDAGRNVETKVVAPRYASEANPTMVSERLQILGRLDAKKLDFGTPWRPTGAPNGAQNRPSGSKKAAKT